MVSFADGGEKAKAAPEAAQQAAEKVASGQKLNLSGWKPR
jgi:hypothetical protein